MTRSLDDLVAHLHGARRRSVATRRAQRDGGLPISASLEALGSGALHQRSAGRAIRPQAGISREHAQHDDSVEHRTRHLGLSDARDVRLACGRDDRHLVVGGLEADVSAMSLTTTASMPLRASLSRPSAAAVAVLGREADERLVAPPRGGESGEDVRRALELDAHPLVGGFLLSLPAKLVRPEVRDGRGHRAARPRARTPALQLRGGLHIEITHPRVAK